MENWLDSEWKWNHELIRLLSSERIMYLASNDICNVSNQEIELPLNVIRFAKFQSDRLGILND